MNKLIGLSKFNLDKWDDGPGRCSLFKFKQNLEEQEHSFDDQKVFCLIQILHQLDEIGHRLTVLLDLVAHWGNVVQQYSVGRVTLTRDWASQSIVNLLRFIYGLSWIGQFVGILTCWSMRAGTWNALDLSILVRLRNWRSIEWTWIKISKLNRLVRAITVCLNRTYGRFAQMNLILRQLNQVGQQLLRLLSFVHIVLVQ